MITSSGGLSDDEIKKMVEESERYAEEDEKRFKEIEARNNADNAIYQAEKTLKEFEAEAEDELKQNITSAKESLEEAIKGDDIEDITAKSQALMEAIFALSSKMYEKNNPSDQDGNQTVDADFKVED